LPCSEGAPLAQNAAMNTKRTIVNLFTTSVLVALSTLAQAQAVIGSGGGSFSNLSSCDYSGTNRDCRIVSTANGYATQVQWGSQHSVTDFVNPSTLTSVDVAFSTQAPVLGLEIGRLDWYNSATLRLDSSLDVFAVSWTLGVHFTAPPGPDPNGQEIFNLSIRNPINPVGDRIYGFELGDLSGLAQSMTLQGVTLSNFRYQVTDMPGGGAGNSWLSTNWWYNDEYNRSRLSILADVTTITSPIPEPETYALLLAGLAVIGWTRRRNGAA
jgi:hypothetical protein